MVKKIALITGISGQDGWYLTKHLYELGYEVWGFVRRNSDHGRLDELKLLTNGKATFRYGDMTDPSSIRKVIKECRPDECYNLAAQSHVGVSFEVPDYTSEVNGTGVISLLEAIKDLSPDTKIYQASTSELYGKTPPPQNEDTPFHPRSPYGVAKQAGFWAMRNYRESYELFASNGILFNHESERRGLNFVTRKITNAVARIKLGLQKDFELGNLESKRDWGHAADYVEAMAAILQHDEPDDFVIATGKAHSVRDFLHSALDHAEIPYETNGKEGVEEKYFRTDTGDTILKINPKFYRPAEVDFLLGDPTKAKTLLNWEPKYSFEELVKVMYNHDFQKNKKRLNK
jgi:GDPmannose 4,6-dehydratase